MTMSPGKLQRVVWVILPAALYFGLKAIRELSHGAVWNGVAKTSSSDARQRSGQAVSKYGTGIVIRSPMIATREAES